jgi:hypothetical protein
LLEAADLEVLKQDVALGGQLADDLLALGAGEIDADRPLVAVGGKELGCLSRVVAGAILEVRGAPRPRFVAGAGTLDLDDVGAKIAENLRGPRSRQHAGKIENTQT